MPNSTLRQFGYGAINFHPGPPAYPGSAPAHFALYDQATEFGVTARIMVEQVDAGSIVETALFAVPAGISVLELEKLAYVHLARLLWRLAKSLATETELPPVLPVEWSSKKYSRRAYRDICAIPLDIPKEEFDRRIRTFGGCHFGISPTIHLHGSEFRAVPSDSGRIAVLAAADS